MNLLIIISVNDGETMYNAIRLANVAVSKGDEVSVFMLGQGVCFEKSSIHRNLTSWESSINSRVTFTSEACD